MFSQLRKELNKLKFAKVRVVIYEMLLPIEIICSVAEREDEMIEIKCILFA